MNRTILLLKDLSINDSFLNFDKKSIFDFKFKFLNLILKYLQN